MMCKNKEIWKPNTSLEILTKRSEILKKIRYFLCKRGVLEVETPSLSQSSATNISLCSFKTEFFFSEEKKNALQLYLITSPEFHMKRLLAYGSGPIFQICHSFRNKEIGCYHNPEFTMLEWYRPHYNMFQLMNEVDDLLQQILCYKNAEYFSYQEIFYAYLGIDPLLAKKNQLYQIISKDQKINNVASINDDKNLLLQVLFSLKIEKYLGKHQPIFVYHFPSEQAELSKINSEDFRISERFEIYYHGIELGNGANELIDAKAQYNRFISDNNKRKLLNLQQQNFDKNLLTALTKNIPQCSGIAIGIDRLIMLALNMKSIKEIMTFTVESS